MAWQPSTIVTINGSDLTGVTLESIRVTRGRDDVFAEPQAGFVACDLIDLTGAGLGLEPLQDISITIVNSLDERVDVFTGQISDTSVRLYDSGEVDGLAKGIVTIIATAALARLNRRQVAFDGLPVQDDGDRIAALIAAALATPWEEVGGTWANVATPTTTWANFDPQIDLDRIDQPGSFEIAALPAAEGGYVALAQGYGAALGGRGTLFDTADGFVAYADGNHRRNAAIADGYLPIPASAIVSQAIQPQSSQADIVNRAIVGYEGGSVTVTDEGSLLQFGLLASVFDTVLNLESQALEWALDYVEDHARPVRKLRQVGIRLDTIDDDLRDQLLGVDVNSPVVLTGMPATLGIGSQFAAFVEGLDFRIDEDTTELVLTVSDASLSIGSDRWGQVAQTVTWADVGPALRWQDAAEVQT